MYKEAVISSSMTVPPWVAFGMVTLDNSTLQLPCHSASDSGWAWRPSGLESDCTSTEFFVVS